MPRPIVDASTPGGFVKLISQQQKDIASLQRRGSGRTKAALAKIFLGAGSSRQIDLSINGTGVISDPYVINASVPDYPDLVTDWNTAIQDGVYYSGAGAANAPPNTSGLNIFAQVIAGPLPGGPFVVQRAYTWSQAAAVSSQLPRVFYRRRYLTASPGVFAWTSWSTDWHLSGEFAGTTDASGLVTISVAAFDAGYNILATPVGDSPLFATRVVGRSTTNFIIECRDGAAAIMPSQYAAFFWTVIAP